MISLRPKASTESRIRDQLLEKVTREADGARRLAMYDRATGLYASWYLARRFAEEAKRATRYDRNLSVVVIEITKSDGFKTHDEVTEYINAHLRVGDMATHLGDGRYMAYLPETSRLAAEQLIGRMTWQFDHIATGVAEFPADGEDLGTLQSIAESRVEDHRPGSEPMLAPAAFDIAPDLRSFGRDEPEAQFAV